MKILLISGSTKAEGATERAVKEAADVFLKNGVLYEIFNLYPSSLASCSGCGICRNGSGCIHNDDATRLANICADFDGYIFFTPVHYGGATGAMKSAMGRLFYSKRKYLEYKPAAAVAVSRRAGNITAIEELSRFFYFASMPVVCGSYPGVLYGATKDAVENDAEGLGTVRSIAENMIWLLRCIDAGKAAGIYPK